MGATKNDLIRKISTAGNVTTLAGVPFAQGWVDGTGSDARFNYPYGIAVDPQGNVYVGDSANHFIRKGASAQLLDRN